MFVFKIKRMNNMIPVMVLLVLPLSCAINTGKEPEKNVITVMNDHPTNYSAYVLTGSNLLATTAYVNGITIDTVSVDSISNSVASILNSGDSNGIVAEVDSKNVDYTIDYTAAGKPVLELFYGADIQIASKAFLAIPEYIELIRNIKVDIIRFPGGGGRVRYERDPSNITENDYGNYKPYRFYMTGLDVANYISLCRNLGIQAEPEINLYVDNVAMASNMADQIVNELGYDLKYISGGNEPDANDYSNWTFMNATNLEQSYSNYVDRFNRYIGALRTIKPGLTFTFLETSSKQFGNYINDVYQTVSKDLVFSWLGTNQPGAYSSHWYMLGDYGQDPSYPDYPSVDHLVLSNEYVNNINHLFNLYNTMKQTRDQYMPGAKIFLGEWGACWSAASAGIHGA